MKIYISGKITGLDIEHAENIFNQTEKYLKSRFPYAKVINPMKEIPYDKDKSWEQYMLEDISILFQCDTIFMIPNWEDSRGARIELNIAKETKKDIIYGDNLESYKNSVIL